MLWLRRRLNRLFDAILDWAEVPSSIRVVFVELVDVPVGWVVETVNSKGDVLTASEPFDSFPEAQTHASLIAQAYMATDDYTVTARVL